MPVHAVSTARPSEVAFDYVRASRDPYSPENSALIRFIERRVQVGWPWPAGAAEADSEVEAVGELSTAVRATREARVSPAARAALDAIQRARALAGEAKSLRKIRAVRT